MLPIQLRRADAREVVLSFPQAFGWFFTLAAGGGGAWLYLAVEPEKKQIVGGFVAFMVLLGLVTVLRRYRVRFDLTTRRYEGIRGHGPKVDELAGAVDELRAVQMEARLEGKGRRVRYYVALDFGADHRYWSSPLRIVRGSMERTLVEQQKLADLFGVPATLRDSTGLANLRHLHERFTRD